MSPGENGATAGDAALTAVVVGAGNIGSAFVRFVASMPRLARVVIVDRDSYAPENLSSQAISAADLGRAKARVMAQRLRVLAPHLRVEAIVADLGDIPPARLRAEVWVTCLDSRASRQVANELVHRLAVGLWLDAGVLTSQLLVRVSVYAPHRSRACLECLWDEDDYRDVAQSYACDGGGAAPAPTDGVAEVGSLCASMLALELRKLLDAWEAPVEAREVVAAAGAHRFIVSELRRHDRCRFDHQVWLTERVCWRRFGDAARAATAAGVGGAPALRVEGRAFARDAACGSCGHVTSVAALGSRAGRPQLRCRNCGAAVRVGGECIADTLSLVDLPTGVARLSLRAAGLRRGDLVTLSGGAGERHFELAWSAAVRGRARRRGDESADLQSPAAPRAAGRAGDGSQHA